jgi:uncharacterized protein (TIGR00730 family)
MKENYKKHKNPSKKYMKNNKNYSRKKSLNVPASKLPTYTEPQDFRDSPHWRVMRIQAEFINGFQFLADFKKTVTFFGSARFDAGNQYYQTAEKLAEFLGREGFGVVTGGGPGIMEAANRGAASAKADSIGLNIQLPFEQRANPYIQKSIGFHYFFTRKVMLAYSAKAYVFFPGGYGTLDEFFEIIVLVQTKKFFDKIPIVCVGKDYWQGLDKWMYETVYYKNGAIDSEDLKIYKIVDTAEEAFDYIKKELNIDINLRA